MHLSQVSKVGLLFVLFSFDLCVSFHEKPGKCPKIESVDEFNMQRFLGVWYIIQGSKTATESNVDGCVQLNFTEIDSQNFTSTQLPQNWTSTIRIPDLEHPSHLLIKLNDENEAAFHVLVTDYENYGSFMICNDLDGPKQRRAAAILSRAPKLDDKYYQLMREHLSKYSMEEEDLTPIFKCD